MKIEYFYDKVCRDGGFDIFPVQRKVLSDFYAGSFMNEELVKSKSFRHLTLVWGRRSGKDFVACVAALYEAHRLLVAPLQARGLPLNSFPQCIQVVTHSAAAALAFCHQLRRMSCDMPMFLRWANNEVHFENPDNGARVCVSVCGANSSEKLIGKACNAVFMLEVACYKKGLADSVYSMLYPVVTGGSFFFISSPRGENDFLHRMVSKNDPETMVSQLATWEVNPKDTREFLLESMEKGMTEEQFNMEFGAQFAVDPMTEQVTLRLRVGLIEKLKKIARKRSFELDEDVTYTDVLRELAESAKL